MEKKITFDLIKDINISQNKWLVEMYSKGQVTETDTCERSKSHPLIIMIKLSVIGSKMENYQKFLHHVDEEERRHANKHSDEEYVSCAPHSIRQKKVCKWRCLHFQKEKTKQNNNNNNKTHMGRDYFISFQILIFYGPMLESLQVLQALLLHYTNL